MLRGRARADLVYLGWQPARAQLEPGPMPQPPPPRAKVAVRAGWQAEQQREQNLLIRRARMASGFWAVCAGGVLAGWLASLLSAGAALTIGLAVVLAEAGELRGAVRSHRDLSARIRAEAERAHRLAAVGEAELTASRAAYARRARVWQQRSAASLRQPRWRPVTMPVDTVRLDVTGGTPEGLSGLLSMIVGTRIAAGGEITVFDLAEAGTGAQLVALAAGWGIRPSVTVLPADLPQIDLGCDLRRDSLAEVLAVAAGGDSRGAGELARDAALLGRVLQLLGPAADLVQLTAALRVLAQIGDPRDHLSEAELSASQLTALAAAFGSVAGHLLVDRASALEASLRILRALGTAPGGRPVSPLRVTWTDRSAPAGGNRVLGSYLVAAFAESLRLEQPGPSWRHTVCVLGADRLPAEVLDPIMSAAGGTRTGLVLCYETIPAPVRARLGRGNAAVAVMRLGNAEDARAAAEQIGHEYRFVVGQLTETVGGSLADTAGASHTATAGTSQSLADSESATISSARTRSEGRSRPGMATAFDQVNRSAGRDASRSVALSGSRSVTAGLSASTAWGWNAARTTGVNESVAGTAQRVREPLVEQHELQHLPPTAVLLCQPGPRGRQLVLADANPQIMALPTATLACPLPALLG